jgi:general secretion pathway protein C
MMMNNREMSKLFWAVKVSLVALLLYVAIGAVLTPSEIGVGLKPKAVSGDESIDDGLTLEAKPPVQVDYSAIVENDIFAGPRQESRPDVAVPEKVVAEVMPSAEELGLKLVGVIAGGPVASRAIIEDTATKMASPYKIGSMVGSATIESIEPERVVLLHGGRRLALVLQTGTAATNPNPAGPSQAPPMPEPKVTRVEPQAPTSSTRLGYVEELFREATIKPYVKDGKTEGLEITGLEQTPLAKLFGLRNGDVVRTVNGQSLSSKQKAFQVLKKARTQPKISLELLRQGKTKELSFDL